MLSDHREPKGFKEIPKTAKYHIDCSFTQELSTIAGNTREIGIYRSGTIVERTDEVYQAVSGLTIPFVSTKLIHSKVIATENLASGAIITVRMFQNTGIPLTVSGTGGATTLVIFEIL